MENYSASIPRNGNIPTTYEFIGHQWQSRSGKKKSISFGVDPRNQLCQAEGLGLVGPITASTDPLSICGVGSRKTCKQFISIFWVILVFIYTAQASHFCSATAV
jgi:hypothetical protein